MPAKKKYFTEEERIAARKEFDRLKYINRYSGLTKEEIIRKKEATKAYQRQYTAKKRREAGIKEKVFYKTKEEKKKAARRREEEYRRRKGMKPIKKYNTKKERENARKETLKRYYKKNKKKENERVKEYNKKNPEKVKKRRKLYREKNKKERNEYQINYREKNKERDKPKIRTYVNKRYHTDILYKLNNNISVSLKSAFKRKKFPKNERLKNILGCSFEFLKIYLESKFELWMTWENKGNWNGIPKEINIAWDIDHIIPIDSATNEKELIKLFHYSNLQPLCSYTNRWIKSNKLI